MVVQALNESTVLTVLPSSSSESCCAVVQRKMQSINETINCEISLHVVIVSEPWLLILLDCFIAYLQEKPGLLWERLSIS